MQCHEIKNLIFNNSYTFFYITDKLMQVFLQQKSPLRCVIFKLIFSLSFFIKTANLFSDEIR